MTPQSLNIKFKDLGVVRHSPLSPTAFGDKAFEKMERMSQAQGHCAFQSGQHLAEQ